MKKITATRILRGLMSFLILVYLMSLDLNIYSQPGLPPGHGQNGGQGAGGMAPLGEGIVFMLLGAAVYGMKKWWSNRKKG